MTVRTTRSRTAAALVLFGVLLLTGCTGGGDDGGSASTASEDHAGGGTSDPGSASAPDGEMATKKLAAPHGGGEAYGGELTVTLRSVEVGAENMTVRWALRWDDDESPDDAAVRYYDLGAVPIMTVTDRAALKAYRPYCTQGAWQPGDDAEFPGNERAFCESSMLVSPQDDKVFRFPNHGTVEAWALLPAPEDKPERVDVAPAEGLPMFTDATVTYLDGGDE